VLRPRNRDYHADRDAHRRRQLPHLELTREIVRRFNYLYGTDILREPKEILTEAPKVPGLDGRKMSKSYGNAIFIAETQESLKPKVMQMLTDVKRMRKTDPGEPKDCNLYPFHEFFTGDAVREEIQAGCRNATLGCVDCKKILIKNLVAEFSPVWEKIAYYKGHTTLVDDILKEGGEKAARESELTIARVREAMKL
jgi:tryptophanyl-tRNA synthetase